MKKFIKKHKTKLIVFAVLIALGSVYFVTKNSTNSESQNYYIVEEIKEGDVNAGIATSGSIVAAQKLNLDVYKQTSRIDEVNMINGMSVSEGDLLFSFDSSDISVDITKSNIDAKQARLDIDEQKVLNSNTDTAEVQLLQKIADLEKSILDTNREYLSADFEALPVDEDDIERARPRVSGQYVGSDEGDYIIEVYRSSSDSGYSFRYSGLESGRETIYSNQEVKLGTKGVYLIFSEDIKSGDEWIVSFPNESSQLSVSITDAYNAKIKSLESQLVVAHSDLGELRRTGNSDYKNVYLEKAKLSLLEANQSLREKYDMLDERVIKAPFSGTIEGIENVFVGATPKGGTEDPVEFGTLISNEFHAEFLLTVDEVAKVELDQKVVVTMNSSAGQKTLDASIIEISSLPESGASPKYIVKALIQKNEEISLREGVLVDIQVISDKKTDVLIVPNTALNFNRKEASLLVVPDLTNEQREVISQKGVLPQDTSVIDSYRVDVETGLVGAFNTEIISGAGKGDYIILSTSANMQESNLLQGGARGGGKPQSR